MSLELLLLPDSTLVLGMRCKTYNFNIDSFVICGADDAALERPHGPDGEEGGAVVGWGGGGGGCGGDGGGAMEEWGGESEGFELGEREVEGERHGWVLDKSFEDDDDGI
ncbi:hypothetical protein Hanom_Chr12g01080721 [Helianthus anomalus]